MNTMINLSKDGVMRQQILKSYFQTMAVDPNLPNGNQIKPHIPAMQGLVNNNIL